MGSMTQTCFAMFLFTLAVDTAWSKVQQGKKQNQAEDGRNVQTQLPSVYSEMLDKINEAARGAIAAHNQGDHKAAERQVDLATEIFEHAIAVHPEKHDAYCEYGNFCLNINRFKSASEHFSNCLQRMEHIKEGNAFKAYIAHLVTYTRYGEASFERDRAYKNGNGDMEETLRWMNKQLEVYPKHPTVLYDKGILLINMAAVNDTAQEAADCLRASQEAAVAAFADCQTAQVVADWRKGSQVTIHEIDGQGGVDRAAYIAEFRNTNISGDDGVIIPRESCEIYVPSGEFTSLPNNIRLNEVWTTETPSREHDPFRHVNMKSRTKVKIESVPEAASIIGFGSAEFYHSLIELGSRLVLLSEFLPNKRIPIIIPKSKTVSSLLKRLGIKNPVIVSGNSMAATTRYQVGKLWYPHWPSCDLATDGCLSTPPAQVLQKLQAALVPNPSKTPPSRILFLPRQKKLRMRFLLREKEVLKSFPGAERFKPGAVSLDKAIEAFQSASMVIGVHGGALSNILFCQPGTRVVEFGWPQVPMLGHFRHMSAALKLDYRGIPVARDPRGIGAANVSVDMATLGEESIPQDEL